jgi:DNA-binding transcriptional regulator LsrR (DeoR family)
MKETETRIAKLERLYIDEDMNLRELENETGISRSTLSRIMRQYNIVKPNMSHSGKKHEQISQTVSSLYNQGKDIDEIAKLVKLSKQSIMFCLQENGIISKTRFRALDNLLTETQK